MAVGIALAHKVGHAPCLNQDACEVEVDPLACQAVHQLCEAHTC